VRVKRLLINLLATASLVACGVAVTEPPPSTTPAQTVLEATTLYPTPTVPAHLRLTGIDASVVPLTLTGSELVPPPDPTVLGWWGRRAGARHGVTLLVGHTVHTGGGALDDLESVPVGSTARLSRIAYEVTSVHVVSKPALAAEAAVLFSQHGEHQLVVVTCEDYDAATGEYASNVVLTAEPRSGWPAARR
jgi:Sortase domain